MPVLVPDYQTLSAMITPAIFLTATGSLIISTSNRMSRVVDRIRVLTALADALDRGVTDLDFVDDRLRHVSEQIEELVRRGNAIRLALTTLYLGFAAFVGTSLALAVDVLFAHRVVVLPTGLAVVGVSLILIACIHLVREALDALRGNRREVLFLRRLAEQRRELRQGDTT